jgi:hypothetical protein
MRRLELSVARYRLSFGPAGAGSGAGGGFGLMQSQSDADAQQLCAPQSQTFAPSELMHVPRVGFEGRVKAPAAPAGSLPTTVNAKAIVSARICSFFMAGLRRCPNDRQVRCVFGDLLLVAYLRSLEPAAGLDDLGCGELRQSQVVASPTQSNLPHVHSTLPSLLVQFAPVRLPGAVSVPPVFPLGSALAPATRASRMGNETAVAIVNFRRIVGLL